MHLTDIVIRALKPPAKGQKDYVDDSLKGFSVRVSQGGTKVFTLVHGSPRKRVNLGRSPETSLPKPELPHARRPPIDYSLQRRGTPCPSRTQQSSS